VAADVTLIQVTRPDDAVPPPAALRTHGALGPSPLRNRFAALDQSYGSLLLGAIPIEFKIWARPRCVLSFLSSCVAGSAKKELFEEAVPLDLGQFR
jgi:hypothetical protein